MTTNESLIRERDFYKSKVEDLENRVKELSTEHAYIQKENEDDRNKSSINVLNLTTIISLLLWCFAFALNKEIMTSDIHN